MPEDKADFKEALLEAMTEAAMQGHDLEPFEPVDTLTGGFEAHCRVCGRSVWVGTSGVMYSILAESCPGRLED